MKNYGEMGELCYSNDDFLDLMQGYFLTAKFTSVQYTK